MKTLPMTRKLKEQLAAWYGAGGLPENAPGDIGRTDLKARETLYAEHKARQARKARRLGPMPLPAERSAP